MILTNIEKGKLYERWNANYSSDNYLPLADAIEAAVLAKEIGYKIISHPGPSLDGLRAFVECDESRDPASHFKRNRTIVDVCDYLLVVPLQNEPQSRGGTWYTYDYAVKKNKPFMVFYPGV